MSKSKVWKLAYIAEGEIPAGQMNRFVGGPVCSIIVLPQECNCCPAGSNIWEMETIGGGSAGVFTDQL